MQSALTVAGTAFSTGECEEILILCGRKYEPLDPLRTGLDIRLKLDDVADRQLMQETG